MYLSPRFFFSKCLCRSVWISLFFFPPSSYATVFMHQITIFIMPLEHPTCPNHTQQQTLQFFITCKTTGLKNLATSNSFFLFDILSSPLLIASSHRQRHLLIYKQKEHKIINQLESENHPNAKREGNRTKRIGVANQHDPTLFLPPLDYGRLL